MAFRGGKSLESTTSTQTRSGPRGYAHTWKLKSITPGCIAAAAIIVSSMLPPQLYRILTTLTQAQFIISNDREFGECGAHTKINYAKRLDQYKRLIVKLIETPGMVALIAQLNADVLGIHVPNQAAPSEPASVQEPHDEEDDYLRAFKKVNPGMTI